MLPRMWRFGWDRHREVDLFSDLFETNTETLSQAINAAVSEEPDADGSVLFGHLQGTVVGLRYYTGMVNRGEMVALVREPQNQYDRNAVMVANMYGSQVGHVKRELAAAMANIMDNNLVKVEGEVYSGTNNKYTMPVMLSFWGKEEDRDSVIEHLRRYGYKLMGEKKSTFTKKSYSAQWGSALPAKATISIPLTTEELKNAFDNLFDGLMESKDGEKEAAEAVGTPLLPHQKQALSWMCACENSSGLPPFWEKRKELYYNSLTCFSVKERPQRVHGGILADDMGLGKTLTTIALILTNCHNGKPLPLERCEAPLLPAKTAAKTPKQEGTKAEEDYTGVKNTAADSPSSDCPQMGVMRVDSPEKVEEVVEPERSRSKGKQKAIKPKAKREAAVLLEDVDFAAALSGSTSDRKSKIKKAAKKATPDPGLISSGGEKEEETLAKTTLIICPLSVLSNWLEQFEEHVCTDVKLKIYLYYGPTRNRSSKFLLSQDVVLTTYNVLSADYGNKSPLHEVNWLRVVLDEGHIIRNPNAQMSKAVLDLKAQRQWILSGTPIQNSVKDLWMLLAFLRLKPFNVREWWNRVIQRPVMQGDKVALQNLQTLVKCITLRRTKTSKLNGRSVVSLPEKTVCVEYVVLTQQEREEYELARNEGRRTISRYVAEGTVLRNYADVLAIMMRLRQHCCHPDLLANISSDLASTPVEMRDHLMEKLRLVLASGSDEECSVCLDSVRMPVITHCAHVYCRPCIAQVISSEQEMARCPLCRSEIKTSQLVEFSSEDMEEDDKSHSAKWRTSSKVEALMGHLLRLRYEDSSTKCLVVSQFTRFLTILETPLRLNNISFVRLDGTMSQKRRTQVIQEFQDPAPNRPAIMLLSLKAGGVGLNLTAASRVFLMDPAWNPAAEDQCIDRCHRLGQKRKVLVTKFIVRDSVEENMVKIQRKKQDLVEKAFGSKTADRKSSHIDDIKAVMEL